VFVQGAYFVKKYKIKSPVMFPPFIFLEIVVGTVLAKHGLEAK